MDNVNKTLYIPLYGKALVSRRGILLSDPTAEAIWAETAFPLGRKSRSKWLAFHMAMRAAVFDRWVEQRLAEAPDAWVLHLGCGLDSRVLRVKRGRGMWIDMDLPAVIARRKRHYRETDTCRMIAGDICDDAWLEAIPVGTEAIILMEGVSMYLPPEALEQAVARWAAHFSGVHLLMDCYSPFAARASRFKSPVNEVGVTRVYGREDPALGALTFLGERTMTPEDLICQLSRREQLVFRRLYAGAFARKLYRIYEYRS